MPIEIKDEWVRVAGEAILGDLRDRRGISSELDQIDDDTIDEIRLAVGRVALEAVAPLIIAAEREECAKIADDVKDSLTIGVARNACEWVAAVIRARATGKKELQK